MPEFKIRPYKSSDAADVVKLWKSTLPSSHPWNEPVSVICHKRIRADGLFFVGEVDCNVEATVMAGYDGVRGWIYSLTVSEEHQRQGFGRKILAFAEDALRARGCRKIGLQIRDTNLDVVAFYERCGYGKEDRASMAKVLPVTDVVDPVPTIGVGDSISLSQITSGDKRSLLQHLNETKAFSDFMVHMPFPYLEIDADEWITKVTRGTLEADHDRNWAIRFVDKETGPTLIGGAGLFNISDHCAEIGYWIAKPFWRRGIASSVVDALCTYGFNEMKLLRVWAKVLSGNDASISVLRKSGFQAEGLLRSHFCRDGQLRDVHEFGRLKHDPLPATSAD